MSIDTNTEKLALISYHQPWNTPIPISSDGIGADDSKQLIWEYPGLTWAEIFETPYPLLLTLSKSVEYGISLSESVEYGISLSESVEYGISLSKLGGGI